AGRAEEGRSWLEDLAGDSIEHITREIEDPMSKLFEDGYGGDDTGDPSPGADGDPDREAGPVIDGSLVPPEVMQKFHEQAYSNWSDEPVPALGNRTPRQAIGTEKGRREVVRLIQSYERSERTKAPAQKRQPIDYGFLWEQIGLERPE
ncbi:MAG: MbcA/ParS/Xre antitoxin family protein, partial [Holophagales bacterium]|nr:MbcA/ParS/Xre antitoxin family protein [Holophagales bacterium]